MCVLLIILPMTFIAWSFLDFSVSTSYFPDVEDRYVCSMFMIEGIFSSCSFNPEYMVASSML